MLAGTVKQDESKKGHCFGMSAAASADGLGNMVIGLNTSPETGEQVWHAVVQTADGATYDPTMRQWFEPGVYEQSGFSPRLVLTPEQVRAFVQQNDGLVPDAQNQGLVSDEPAQPATAFTPTQTTQGRGRLTLDEFVAFKTLKEREALEQMVERYRILADGGLTDDQKVLPVRQRMTPEHAAEQLRVTEKRIADLESDNAPEKQRAFYDSLVGSKWMPTRDEFNEAMRGVERVANPSTAESGVTPVEFTGNEFGGIDQPVLTQSGKPFQTKGAAVLASRGRSDLKGRDLIPVEVDGGWGLAERNAKSGDVSSSLADHFANPSNMVDEVATFLVSPNQPQRSQGAGERTVSIGLPADAESILSDAATTRRTKDEYLSFLNGRMGRDWVRENRGAVDAAWDLAANESAATGQEGSGVLLNTIQADEARASEILDRAGVTGKERLDIIKDFRAGKNTLADLESAYPSGVKDSLTPDVDVSGEPSVIASLKTGEFEGNAEPGDRIRDGNYIVVGNYPRKRDATGSAGEKRGREIVPYMSGKYDAGWLVIERAQQDKEAAYPSSVSQTAESDAQPSSSATDGAQEQAEPDSAEARPAAPIGDFGEKIGGARKDSWQEYANTMQGVTKQDLTDQPFSKVWPEPNYQKMLDEGADPRVVGLVRAMRDEVPNKPRAGWKLRGWVEKTDVLRGMALDALADPAIAGKVIEGMEQSNILGSILGRADLYAEVGHGVSLKGIGLNKRHFSLYRGEENVTKWIVEGKAKATAFSNMPREIAVGKTKEEAIANFKTAVAGKALDKPAERHVRFDVGTYGKGEKKGRAVIFKMIGREQVVLAEFDTIPQAREYLQNNEADLIAKLEKFKEIPRHRKESNSPRVGADHRNGADVTSDQFMEAFGFRGVEFGNYVEQKRRQADLNRAYDALMDLAGVLNVPSRAMSLNGEMGLAFGARGSGGKDAPAAHYESGKVVINLTKKEGAGSLAHEWFHGLDNYFSRARKDKDGFLSERAYARGEGVRPEVVEAFAEIQRAINKTRMQQRSKQLDRTRTKDYWQTGAEMSARAFESYVIEKLKDANVSNDYLANIVSEEYWNAAAALGMDKEGSYPYPEAAEIPVIREAFDNLFRVVETKETDTGVALLSLGAGENLSPMSLTATRAVVDRIVTANQKRWNVHVETVPTYSALPQAVKDAVAKYGEEGKAKGVLHNGTVYVVADLHTSEADVETTILHEIEGHVGIHRLYGKDINAALNRLFLAIGGRKGLSRIANERGIADDLVGYAKALGRSEFTDDVRVQIMMDEALAHLAQDRKFGDRVKEIIGAIRQWLRDNGFARLAEHGETDLLHILAQGRKQLRSVQTDSGETVLMVAYHGTPHRFDKFSLDAIGTGEGAQAYGWGLYFAGKREIAEYYRDTLSDRYDTIVGEEKLDAYNSKHLAAYYAALKGRQGAIDALSNDLRSGIYGDRMLARATASAIQILERGDELLPVSQPGNLYQANIPEDSDLLDWDRPLSEQPEVINDSLVEAMNRLGFNTSSLKDGIDKIKIAYGAGRASKEQPTGRTLYVALKNKTGSEQAASQYLNSIGIPGLRYLDGASRSDGGGSHNYVIWDEDAVTIEAVNDELRQAEEKARVRDSGAIETKETDDGGVMMSSRSGDDFATGVLTELATVDDMFRYPASQKTSLSGVFNDVLPETEYLGDDTRADERDESQADRRFAFKSPHGKLFYVYERGPDEVWIDVSSLAEGEGGSGIYAAVTNYAYNTGKVFIGDPNGLSEAAVVRRTSNMLSSALRFGTTRHLEAAPEQVRGNPDRGIEPLRMAGTDIERTRALIHTFLTTLQNQFPRLNDYRYDFARARFVGPDGREVANIGDVAADRPGDSGRDSRDAGRNGRDLPDGRSGFREVLADPDARASRIGEASLRRGILIKSLVESADGQRPGILEQVLTRAHSLVTEGGLDRLFSRTPEPRPGAGVSVSEMVESIKAALPGQAKAVDRMLERGKREQKGGLVIVDVVPKGDDMRTGPEIFADEFALRTGRPMDAKDVVTIAASHEGEVQGVYDRRSGMIFMATDISPASLPGVLLHEATHGQKRDDINARALNMVTGGGLAPARARPFLDGVRRRMSDAGVSDNAEEATAYIVEEAMARGRQAGFSAVDGKFMDWVDANFGKPVGNLIRDFVAMLRSWGLRHGVPINPTVDDLVALAKGDIERAAAGDVQTAASDADGAKRSWRDKPAIKRLRELNGNRRFDEEKVQTWRPYLSQKEYAEALDLDARFDDGLNPSDLARHEALQNKAWETWTNEVSALDAEVNALMDGMPDTEQERVIRYANLSAAEVSDAEVRALVEQYAGVDGAPTEAEIAEAVRQYRDTEMAYGGQEAYEKAKADGKTKLNYRQWVQVRTPNFKRWFGDWESAARVAGIRRALEDVSAGAGEGVAVGLRPDLAGIGGSADVAFPWGDDNLGLSKILIRRGPDVLRRVLDAVAHGRIERHSDGKRTVVLAHGNGRAVLSLDEHGQRKTWLLTGWEEGRPDATGEVRTHSGATQGTPTFGRDALGAGLNVIIPQAAETSKVTDPETGEPMAVYHGTDGEFTSFDLREVRQNADIPSFYFAKNEIEGGGVDGLEAESASQSPRNAGSGFSVSGSSLSLMTAASVCDSFRNLRLPGPFQVRQRPLFAGRICPRICGSPSTSIPGSPTPAVCRPQSSGRCSGHREVCIFRSAAPCTDKAYPCASSPHTSHACPVGYVPGDSPRLRGVAPHDRKRHPEACMPQWLGAAARCREDRVSVEVVCSYRTP